MAQEQNVKGVGVDSDARRVEAPVTVVVWPSGMEQDADTWSDANNYLHAGAATKDGYPTEPAMVLNPDGVPAPGNEPTEDETERRRTAPPAAASGVASPRPTPAPSSS